MKHNLIKKAETFAREKHKDQLRDGGAPYIIHPEQVVKILEQVTDDPNILAAAWLHDTIEDTQTTQDELLEHFGADILNLVLEVTKDSEKRFPDLHSREGVMLKFADRLSNLAGMTAWDEKRQAKYIQKSKFWRSE